MSIYRRFLKSCVPGAYERRQRNEVSLTVNKGGRYCSRHPPLPLPAPICKHLNLSIAIAAHVANPDRPAKDWPHRKAHIDRALNELAGKYFAALETGDLHLLPDFRVSKQVGLPTGRDVPKFPSHLPPVPIQNQIWVNVLLESHVSSRRIVCDYFLDFIDKFVKASSEMRLRFHLARNALRAILWPRGPASRVVSRSQEGLRQGNLFGDDRELRD